MPPESNNIGTFTDLVSETVQQVATRDYPNIYLNEATAESMDASHADYLRQQDAGTPIYGTTTGFGPHVVTEVGGDAQLGASLIAHLAAGYGAAAPLEVVRATLYLRLHTLGRGHSGVESGIAHAYAALLRSGIVPFVPESGSVGASGDLVPLAHIARVLMGEGEAFYDGERLSASECLRRADLKPRTLSGREALALVNGTSFLSAYAALAVSRAARLLALSETLTGWLYRLLGCRAAALDDRLHQVRRHAGQIESARHIREEAERHGEYEDVSRPLQEVYSLRCAPQILGACRQNISYARAVIETEINGVDDNPVFFTDRVLHGGNFHGQAVGFAADTLNAALTQVAVLAERQIALLCTPSRHNEFAPLLLAYEPGRDSGLAGAQLTATALLAEMRGACQQFATSSIPTNADNQDVVPMATLAAQTAYRQTDRLAAILAVLHMSAAQLDFLRRDGKATERVALPPPDLPPFEPLRADRALHGDIARIAGEFTSRTL